MSLMKTLARVAVGVAVAKGAQSLTRSARAGKSGTILDDYLGGGRATAGGAASGGAAGGGGLGGLLDSLQGTKTTDRRTGASSGGLTEMLGSLAGAGGLGGLLGGLTGGAAGGGFGQTLESQFETTPQPPQNPTADQESLAAVMLLAMVQAAQSDGEMDETERGRIMEHLNEATPQERAFVEGAMAKRMDASDLASMVPNGAEAQVYAMSLAAIDLDHMKEADFLRKFSDHLGLPKDTVNDIHARMGAPELFS